jgi:hypothetical protein
MNCYFRVSRLFVGLALALAGVLGAKGAQSFHLSTSQTEVVVPSGVNPLPTRIPLLAGTAGLNLAGVTTTSDANWVVPTVDAANTAIRLSFAAAGLPVGSYTATITVSDGGSSEQFFVKAAVSTLSVVALVDDPKRSRTYGLHQNGLNLGALVVFDPIQSVPVGSITLGKKPTDMAISADGNELITICSVSQSIVAVDLTAQSVSQILALPVYGESDQQESSANIDYGAGNILYYTDGSSGPVLRVYNRQTGTVVQSVLFDGSAYSGSGNGTSGFGDIAVSPDKTTLYGWAQFGWSAGYAGSSAGKFSIAASGAVTPAGVAQVPGYPSGMLRDPSGTPALISRDGTIAIVKQYAFSNGVITTSSRAFPAPVFAMSPNAEVVSTSTAIYETATGNSLYTLPKAAPVQAFTSDYARLVYFDSSSKELKTIDLLQAIGAEKLGVQSSPAAGAVVQAPQKLQWSPQTGIDSYRVYLGTSSSAVTAATPSSTEYLGQVSANIYTLASTLTAGTTYYWRVDAINGSDIAPGAVNSFTVSTLASSVSAIKATTVSAHKNYEVPVGLTSATPGATWSISSTNPWISFSSASGTTPATVNVSLDATKMTVGTNQGSVTVSTTGGAFTIPVTVQVDALALTVIRSDPSSTKLYAISEASSSTENTRAYLLEIDSLAQKVTRVLPVGSSATDLALHLAENRIFIPNWKPGGLLVVNRATFQVEQTFPTSPFGSTGYSTGDVYRVAAGKTGRIVTEEQDQWIDVSLRNTTSGAVITSSSQRQGGGQFEPSGRFYYHGDDNISSAYIRKLDTQGDVMTQVKSASIAGISGYGSRTVVVSEDGTRVFWNGGVFDADLNAVWSTAEVVQSASSDGRYAFSETKIYDIVKGLTLANMPVSTKVSAFNSATGRLVVQNGSSLSFYSPVAGGLLGDAMIPKDGAVVLPPTQLEWKAVPGVDSYRVYLGTSLTAVNAATTGSPEYKGDVTGSSFALTPAPQAGQTYYWRIDYVVGGVVVTSQTQSFAASEVAPAAAELYASTIQGHEYPLETALSSSTPGLAWSASTTDSWIVLVASSGVTPSTLQLKLNTADLPAGLNEGSVTLTAGGHSFSLPVKLQLDPLGITVLRSTADSAKVYAVSEATVTSGTSRAYLLEIDAAQEKILRVLPVGTSATDLAIHAGDNRIYVPNWKPGGVWGVNMTTFTVEKTLPYPPFAGVGYSSKDAYSVSAGKAGRLITEGADQWISVQLYNTLTNAVMATSGQREGGGEFEPLGRYYYHGDNNSSGSQLHKLDTNGDTLTSVKTATITGVNYYGSRVVVVSSNGSRVFWNGGMFDADLNVLWNIGDTIYATSPDGKYAFGSTKIYNTVQKTHILGMPLITNSVSAYNSDSAKLVAQVGQKVRFFPLGDVVTFSAPVLSLKSSSSTQIELSWTDNTLETGFTIQMRQQSAANWTDVTPAIAANAVTRTISSLTANTAYEFRIKADSPTVSSPWSNVLVVTTPPPGPSSVTTSNVRPTSVKLDWFLPSATHDSVVIERTLSTVETWTEVASLAAGTKTYTDTTLQPTKTYRYRLKTVSKGISSSYSTVVQVTTPAVDATPPTTPTGLTAISPTATTVQLSWNSSTDNTGVSGYRIYRDGVQVGTSTWSSYTDSGRVSSTMYTYAVAAYDAQDNLSAQSASVQVTTKLGGAQTRSVTNAETLATVLTEVAANPSATFTINLAAGTYKIGQAGLPSVVGSGTIIQGPEGEAEATIDGASRTNGPIFTVVGDNVRIIDLEFVNVAKQAVAIQYGADGGLIVDCSFESTGSTAAIEGIGCNEWLVIGNAFTGVTGSSTKADAAIFFHSNIGSIDIAYNLILDCDQGIVVRNDSYYSGQVWIEGNMVADNRTTGFGGTAIKVESVAAAYITNNSVYLKGGYENAIEYANCYYPIMIRNNLTNKPISALNSVPASLSTNHVSAQEGWFKDTSSCDLRLATAVSGVVDAGTAIAGMSIDIEGDSRPAGGAFDIGADEYTAPAPATPSTPPPSAPANSSGGGGGGGGAPSYWFTGALCLLVAARWWKTSVTGGPRPDRMNSAPD